MRIPAMVVLMVAMCLGSAASQDGVSWYLMDPFCGKVVSKDSRLLRVKGASVGVWRARAKHVPCCAEAELVTALKLKADGQFDLRKLPQGHYWLVIRSSGKEVKFPAWANRANDFPCNERYTNVITLDPTNDTFDRTVQIIEN